MQVRFVLVLLGLTLLPLLSRQFVPISHTVVTASTGIFSPHPSQPSFGSGCTVLTVGDVDGDGDTDVLMVLFGGPETVWLNDGSGLLSPHPDQAGFDSPNSTALALGDICGDPTKLGRSVC
jgi:hypothetical protein